MNVTLFPQQEKKLDWLADEHPDAKVVDAYPNSRRDLCPVVLLDGERFVLDRRGVLKAMPEAA